MLNIIKECIYPSGMNCTMLLAFLLMIDPTWSQKYNFITVKLGTFMRTCRHGSFANFHESSRFHPAK